MNRTSSESRSFKGSNVYLTYAEKEALKRAIMQYYEEVENAEDQAFIDFFEQYDEKPLSSAYDKFIGKH